ncbi:MAG: hypothetical protein QG656_1186, partial [Candidatus Hydrogenedentes bacterium]|nr:hypothetical protein [Candidatus Hydrogenedentota bacterium]
IRAIRVDAGAVDVGASIKQAESMGLAIAVRAGETAPGHWAENPSKGVDGWELDPGGDADKLIGMVQAVRSAGSKAAIALVTPGADSLRPILEAGGGRHLKAVILTQSEPGGEAIRAVRQTLEQAGYERMSIVADQTALWPAAEEDGSRLAQELLLSRTYGTAATEIPAATMCGGALPEAYVYVSGLAHCLKDTSYIGTVDAGDSIEVRVFRSGPRWQIAVWSTGEPQTVDLDIGPATDLALVDGRNNPLPAPKLKDGSVSIDAVSLPQILSGQGGTPLLEAAWAMARIEAAAIAETEAYQAQLPPEAIEAAKKIAGATSAVPSRLDFFTLLRVFPYIEARWHAHEMPRAVAVPALAALDRLVQCLCVTEQELGEPFLEPIEDTFTRCREYQSLYLTGSTSSTAAQDRGDWLLDEVNRLMTQAERLDGEGRDIEADAVAAAAEWRARSLEFAAKAAPLHLPDPFVDAKQPKENTK